MRILEKSKPGQVLIISLILFAAVSALSIVLFRQTGVFFHFGATAIEREQANNMADAGIEKALWQLNQTAGAYTGETNTTVGTTGTFTIQIETKSPTLKTITSIGYVPNSSKPRATQTIKVDALTNTTNVAFRYAVQIGTGGLNMSNSATINGNVYSNGNISGSNLSHIVGDAFAVGTISSPPTIDGSRNPGSPPSIMPTFDPQPWKDAAFAGGEVICPGGTCTFSGVTQTLTAKKYVGNFSVSNNSVLTMTGPIWVTGNLTVSNSAKIKLADSFGSNGSVFLVGDTGSGGMITISNSGGFEPTNGNPKGYVLLASTSTLPNAVSLSNQGVNAIVYALNGGAVLSNSAQVTSLVSNSLNMQNSATLVYDTGLASAAFSTGPGASWQIKKGTYLFTENNATSSPPTGSQIVIHAAGVPAGGIYPTMELLINDVVVQTFSNVQGNASVPTYQQFNHTHSSSVPANQIKVRFANDGTVGAEDRDLRVDKIVVDGTTYQSEASTTYSVGTWKAADGCNGGFKFSEWINCPGYFQYDQTPPIGSTITIHAAGRPAGGIYPTIELLINDIVVQTFTNVQGNVDTPTYQQLTYTHSTTVLGNQVKIRFANDGIVGSEDRDLRVDKIVVDGTTYESETASTYSEGSWEPSLGCGGGFKLSEWIHCPGYFWYDQAPAGPGSTVTIHAAGRPAGGIYPTIELLINNVVVRTFTNVQGNVDTPTYQQFSYTHTSTVLPGQVKVNYTNDGIVGSEDRDLRVDKIVIDGASYQSEATSTYSVGSWDPVGGCAGGYKMSEWIHCPGYFQYNP